LEEDEDKDDDSLKLVSIPRKFLMEANPTAYVNTEEEIGNQDKGRGKDKWLKDTIEYVESTTDLRRFASQYKGNQVYELKDPLERLLVQAVGWATLKAEHDFNGSLEEGQKKEFQQLYQTRKALVLGASGGDPKAVAQWAAWQEAETGNKPIQVIHKVYEEALAIAEKAVNATEEEAEAMMAASDSDTSHSDSDEEEVDSEPEEE
jgi:hypothetical protein